MLLAVVLTLAVPSHLDLNPLLNQAAPRASALNCQVARIGYRFMGTPGQQFRYAGKTYTIPESRYIELMAMPRVRTISVGGRSMTLEGTGPIDAFRFRWITLPAAPGPATAAGK